jgi:hypothetical protein
MTTERPGVHALRHFPIVTQITSIEGTLLIAGAANQRWQCEQAESDHSQRHGNEIPCDVGL